MMYACAHRRDSRWAGSRGHPPSFWRMKFFMRAAAACAACELVCQCEYRRGRANEMVGHAPPRGRITARHAPRWLSVGDVARKAAAAGPAYAWAIGRVLARGSLVALQCRFCPTRPGARLVWPATPARSQPQACTHRLSTPNVMVTHAVPGAITRFYGRQPRAYARTGITASTLHM